VQEKVKCAEKPPFFFSGKRGFLSPAKRAKGLLSFFIIKTAAFP